MATFTTLGALEIGARFQWAPGARSLGGNPMRRGTFTKVDTQHYRIGNGSKLFAKVPHEPVADMDWVDRKRRADQC